MFVRNPCTHDVRVLKEARSLAHEGLQVTIIAVQRGDASDRELLGGLEIIRVPIDPLHYRYLRAYRGALSALTRLSARRRRVQARALGLLQKVLRRSMAVILGAPARAWRITRRATGAGVREQPLPDDTEAVLHGASLKAIQTSLLQRGRESQVQRNATAAGDRKLAFTSFRVGLATVVGILLALQAIAFVLILPLWILGGAALGLIRYVAGLPRKLYDPLRASFLIKPLHSYFVFVDYVARACRAAAEIGPDICHAHDLNTLAPAYLVSRTSGSALVYDSHELSVEMGTTSPPARIAKPYFRVYERFFIQRTDAVITVNDSIARTLASWHGIAPPCVIMNCPPLYTARRGLDLLRRDLGLEPGIRIALYHGNFFADRGLEELVVAAGDLPDDVVTVFMGDGSLEEELKRLVADEGLTDKVLFRPRVPPTEVLPYVVSADVGVVLFRPVEINNQFASPNKMFDYLMAGVPVVASDLPELSRIVNTYGVGTLVNEADPADVARGITEVLDSPHYDEMRKRARAVALERYNWEKQSQGLLAIYRALTGAGAQAGSSGGTLDGRPKYRP